MCDRHTWMTVGWMYRLTYVSSFFHVCVISGNVGGGSLRAWRADSKFSCFSLKSPFLIDYFFEALFFCPSCSVVQFILSVPPSPLLSPLELQPHPLKCNFEVSAVKIPGCQISVTSQVVPRKRYWRLQKEQIYSYFGRSLAALTPWSPPADKGHSSIVLWTNKKWLWWFTAQHAVPYCLMHSFPPCVTTLQENRENSARAYTTVSLYCVIYVQRV